MSFYNFRTLVVSLAVITGVFVFSLPALAMLDESQYTEEEKIGFAFHQLAGFKPDFEKWITNNPKFKTVTPKERYNLLRHDYYRLEHGFYSYAPDEDFITITTKGKVHKSKKRNDENGLITIQFLEGTGTFFTSQIADIWIAVVPKDLEAFSTLTFDEPEKYSEFIRKIGFSKADAFAVIELKLRPVAVDIKQPVVIDKKPFWPMLVEIGSMTVWNNDMSVLAWSYDAPWYVPASRQQFIELYHD